MNDDKNRAVVPADTGRDWQAERERCAKIGEDWLATFAGRPIRYVPAEIYAADAVSDVVAAIREQPTPPSSTATPADTGREWQPIASAPKDEELLLTTGRSVRVGIWNNGIWTGFGAGSKVTHWRPLPAPPSGTATPERAKPTIAELEAIFASNEPHEVYMLQNGEIRARPVADATPQRGDAEPVSEAEVEAATLMWGNLCGLPRFVRDPVRRVLEAAAHVRAHADSSRKGEVERAVDHTPLLRTLRGCIKHWLSDVEGGLKPLLTSLNQAREQIDAALQPGGDR